MKLITRANCKTLPIKLIAVFTLLISLLACTEPKQDISETLPATSVIDLDSSDALAAYPMENWLTNGGSLSNERYSPLKSITPDNIGKVKAEWRTHLESGLGPRFSGQGEPVVADGIIYLPTGENDVFAVNLDTGEILWKYTANIDPSGVTVCCGWVVRGVAVGEGKVFVGMLDARLIALDQQTGAVVWEKEIADPAAGYGITAAPRYYEGKVYIGVTGGEYQVRGFMQARSAYDGAELWTFHTVPGPGEFGHDTWPTDNEAWRFGGAPIWQTPAIDPELNMLYFSTGNASPDQNGAIRAGDNLFTVSILALDLETGEYRWHFQQTRHDIWDYDSSSPVLLFDTKIDNIARKGLSQISKSGYLFFLDRTTGEALTPIVDTPVPQLAEQYTAATQPIPQGDPVINHCIEEAPEGWALTNNGCTYTPFGREPALYAPLSGSNWMPSSYSPELGYVFVCASENIGGAFLGDFGTEDLGVQTGQMIYGGGFKLPQGMSRTSYRVAMQVQDHRIAWKHEATEGCSSGSTVTASGLLFMGSADGKLRAYDASTGQELWSFQTAAGIHPSPVIINHHGKQKILVYSAGTLFSAGPKGDSLWLLSLDGTIGETVPNELSVNVPSILVEEEEPALPQSAIDIAIGQEIYQELCFACHGPDGQGGHAEGGAMPTDSSLEHIFVTAMKGGDKMPGFAGAYTPEELKSVAAYVEERVLPLARD